MRYILNPGDNLGKISTILRDGDTILLKKGIYKEKLVINANNISLVGEDQDNTIITNGDYYHKIMPDYNECNTFRTYTVYIGGKNCKIANLTIENTSTPSDKYGQAVALYVDGDNFNAEYVTLKSAQDTLFTGPLPKNLKIRYKDFLPDYQINKEISRQRYTYCKIYGDVDFIFGCATVLFEYCDIISINSKHPGGYICAPAHYQETEFGYLFNHCHLISETNQKVYLGRPWRDYGCAYFINCEYDDHIIDKGFNHWDGTERYKTARFGEYPANPNRVEWSKKLTDLEAITYITKFYEYLKQK